MSTFKGAFLFCSLLVTSSNYVTADKLSPAPSLDDGFLSYLPPVHSDEPVAPDGYSFAAPPGGLSPPYDVRLSTHDVSTPASSYGQPAPSYGQPTPAPKDNSGRPYGQPASANSGSGGPVVETQSGLLEGVALTSASGEPVEAWLGVPYAKPPVGELRFQPPQDPEPWKGVQQANMQPNACWQLRDEFFGNFSGAEQWNANTPLSEDCLYLNVHRPRPHGYGYGKPLAVMVWIYGGGFFSGSAALDVYDPTELVAAGDVIVVAMQYRTGALGFLRLSEAKGNAGLMDQAAALKWVYKNIAAFGGDPKRVTLFGNSAGAASIGLHMLAPSSAPMFKRAILQSGASTNPWATQTTREARDRARRLAELLKCPLGADQAAYKCLRDAEPQDIINNEYFTTEFADFPFAPVVDGEFLPEDPRDAFEGARFKRADILAGITLEEANYFLLYQLPDLYNLTAIPALTRKDLPRLAKELNADLSPAALLAVEHAYTPWDTHYGDTAAIRDAVDKMAGDRQFACGVVETSAAHARAGANVWQYQLQQRAPGSPWPRWTGVLHGDEVFFIFGAPLRKPEDFSREDILLSKRMIQYWTNFAKTGDPNYSGDLCVRAPTRYEWPLYEPIARRYMVLSEHYGAPTTGRALRAAQCALWDHFVPRLNDKDAICGKA